MAVTSIHRYRRFHTQRYPVCNVKYAGVASDLSAGSIRRLDGDWRSRLVTCRQGALWITQEGDPNDYLLRAGEVFLITQPGLVLIEAMRPSTLQISPSLNIPAPVSGSQRAVFD